MKKNWYKPLVFWSWNARLEEVELLSQMEDFKKADFGGFIIHARGGLKTPYLGDEWLRLCSVVCKRAVELELDVYLYDEDGWPSGFAGGLVPNRSDEYCQRRVDLSTNRTYRENLMAAYCQQQDGKYTLVWQSGNDIEAPEADLYAFETINRSYTDILNADAIAYFIEVTHEKYYNHLREYFGTVIKGIFTDEPQLAVFGFHWGNAICKAYEDACSRPLVEDLWMLYLDAPQKEESNNTRLIYRSLIQELLNKNFTKPISNWCTEHGIEMTGHFPVEDGQYMQIEANGGVLRQYGDFHMPGIDHLGRRLSPLPLLKQVQSAAEQNGKDRVLSETYGCAGWSLTFEEMKEIWGWQAINGINTPCLHLSAYSLEGRRKRDYPPVFSYQAPWFSQVHHISNWMKNINKFFSECTRFAEILVIQPLMGMFSDYSPKEPHESMRLSNEFRKLTENLRDIQLDYDIGDEIILREEGLVKDDLLCLGVKRYKMIIISETEALEDATLTLLNNFSNNGGIVYFIGRTPEDASLISAHFVTNYAPMLRKHLLHIQWKFPIRLKTTDDAAWITGVHTFIGKEEDGSLRIGLYPFEEGWAHREINVYLPGTYELFLMNDEIKEHSLLPAQDLKTNDGMQTRITLCLSSRTLVMLKANALGQENTSRNKKTTSVISQQIVPLRDFSVSRLDPNCLALDFVKLFLNNKMIESQISTYKVQEKINQLIDEHGGDTLNICVQYKFQLSSEFNGPLTLAAETTEMDYLEINGIKINTTMNVGFFIDKSIRCFEMDSSILDRTNTVNCYYTFDGTTMNRDLSFETERNRYCPDKEIENIYILGDFSVEVNQNHSDHPRYLLVGEDAAPNFVISPTSPLVLGDLTPQGLWFYRGNVTYTVSLPVIPANQRILLSMDEYDGVFCIARINNNEEIPIFSNKVKLDLTKQLNNLEHKENVLTLTLFGSNRNVFGPHHHRKGELDFVGPESFEGKYNWTDVFSPEYVPGSTWIDGYTFIHFGVDRCNLIIELQQ